MKTAFRSTAAAALLALTGLQAQAASLLTDGDFESFSSQLGSEQTVFIAAGSMLGAWTVGDSVALVGNGWQLSGGISVDLFGEIAPGQENSTGSISQTLMVSAGQTYTLSWQDYGGESFGSHYDVSFGDTVHHFFAAGTGLTTERSLQWTATSNGPQTITFARTVSKDLTELDNIQLTSPVPEPGTAATLLAGLAAIGFLARRRGSKGRS